MWGTTTSLSAALTLQPTENISARDKLQYSNNYVHLPLDLVDRWYCDEPRLSDSAQLVLMVCALKKQQRSNFLERIQSHPVESLVLGDLLTLTILTFLSMPYRSSEECDEPRFTGNARIGSIVHVGGAPLLETSMLAIGKA